MHCLGCSRDGAEPDGGRCPRVERAARRRAPSTVVDVHEAWLTLTIGSPMIDRRMFTVEYFCQEQGGAVACPGLGGCTRARTAPDRPDGLERQSHAWSSSEYEKCL